MALRHALLITTSITLASVSALAADLPSRKQSAAPATASAFSWNGLYFGGTAGALSLNTSTRGDGGSLYEDTFGRLEDKSRGAGALIGGTVGFNHQYANKIVAGLEADFAYSTAQNSFSQSKELAYSFSGTVIGAANGKTQITSFGTARARVGVAMDRTLVYATGGLAFGGLKTNYAMSLDPDFAPALNVSGSLSKFRLGWTMGGGVEHAITNNISVKAEALYFDLGSVTARASDGSTASFKNDGALGRLGVNFKF
jgi:outer membrane immunogenic protein